LGLSAGIVIVVTFVSPENGTKNPFRFGKVGKVEFVEIGKEQEKCNDVKKIVTPDSEVFPLSFTRSPALRLTRVATVSSRPKRPVISENSTQAQAAGCNSNR